MNVRNILVPALFCAILLCAEIASAQTARRSRKPHPDGIAVVEFFTTENCISCRQGSEVIRELADTSKDEEGNVFVLSFHVDYLKSGAWFDPYASEVFTKRQETYAQLFNVTRLVPGTVIINGKQYVKNSRAKIIPLAVTTALLKKPRLSIALSGTWREPGVAATVSYDVSGRGRSPREYLYLHRAVVEHRVEREIRDGDNAGYTFRHTNTVRSFETIRMPPEGSGELDVILPAQLEVSNCSVIIFVQDPRNYEILGASRLQATEIATGQKGTAPQK